MLDRLALRPRAHAGGVHLLISTGVAALAGALVFGFWYPGIYRLMSGGRDLFMLVTAVDVVLGPLLTFAVFDLKKGWPHLRRDLAVIGAMQLVALVYGLHTVYVARPVAMVFEVDRLRVVTANDVHLPELPDAPLEYRSLPLTGPWLLSTRAPAKGDEHNEALFMALRGLDVSQRPKFWRPYDEGRSAAMQRSRPIDELLKRNTDRAAEFIAELSAHGLSPSRARFLPVTARGDWVAVLDDQGTIVTYLPAEGFF